MLCRLQTATLVGVDAVPVEVEVDVSAGLPGFHLVGLPDGAMREGSVRVRAALSHCGFDFSSTRVTVNLAPADLRKDGAAFDLPIALGSLGARELVRLEGSQMLFAGELALDGRLRPIRGALSLAQSARGRGLAGIVVPRANAAEAALVERLDVYGLESLGEVIELVAGVGEHRPAAATAPAAHARERMSPPDFADVCGQAEARRAAEIAAAGGHNLMLVGPPGSGKTMVASRIAGVLPAMSRDEAIETTKIHSVAGLTSTGALLARRPFRAPHHSCSAAGLVGGGSHPRPGEVSLAHNGVLFLDELPEFQRPTLECLRQPLEDGEVTVVRAKQSVTFPARFMLVAAMNPCPCGYRGSDVRTCTCGEIQARRYRQRISGPLLDRFDLFVRVEPVTPQQLLDQQTAESSSAIAERVAAARQRQQARFARCAIHSNAQMNARQLRRYVQLDDVSRALLAEIATPRRLSARAIHRSLRVARTLADLADRPEVEEEQLALALMLQRERWID